jgi:tyrosine-protein kinase Etk/Wzc
MPHQEQAEHQAREPEEVVLAPLVASDKSYVLEPLIVVVKRKSLIMTLVVGVAVLTAIVSLLLPKYYTANTKILPPQENTSIASAMLGQLGPLIGAAAGRDLGIRNPNEMYVAMLRSRTVSDNLIDRFSLMTVYREKLRVEAKKRLDTSTEIMAGRDNVISISVEDQDPRRAADMANAYVDELSKLTKTLAVTDAAKRRLFFEREVKAASDELARVEDALKRTEESTGIIQLDGQAKVMLQAFADLRAQMTAKEVQVQAMKSFATPENPDLVRAEQELAALRTQVARFETGRGGASTADIALAKVPGAGLEYARKFRDVKYRETLLELLTKQYEIARIDESKDAAIVQVLDKAVPPERRSWPPRTALVVASTLFALLLAVSAAFLLEWLQKANENPQFTARLHLLKFYLQRRTKP